MGSEYLPGMGPNLEVPGAVVDSLAKQIREALSAKPQQDIQKLEAALGKLELYCGVKVERARLEEWLAKIEASNKAWSAKIKDLNKSTN